MRVQPFQPTQSRIAQKLLVGKGRARWNASPCLKLLSLFPLKKFALIFRDTVLIAALAIIPAAASALFHPKQPIWKRELAKDEVLLATVEGWKGPLYQFCSDS